MSDDVRDDIPMLMAKLYLQPLEMSDEPYPLAPSRPTDSLLYIDEPDDGALAVRFSARHLEIGELRYEWEGASQATPGCVASERLLILDLPADEAEALAVLGPILERQRSRYRDSFFRCRNCNQNLPPSLRSDSAPRKQSLCQSCGSALGYAQIDY